MIARSRELSYSPQHTGDFSQTDVAELISILKNGALPLEIQEVAFAPGPTCTI